MGRRKTIDREKVLEAAESVIAAKGAGALTIDAVAQAAGITKGGVQSCFGTKEALVEAMLVRWGAMYADEVRALVGNAPSAFAGLGAHIDTTAHADDEMNARTAALLASLMQSPAYMRWVREWYGERFRGIAQLDGEPGARARIAFLATEGLFLLRHFGLMDMTRKEWETYFAEINGLIGREAAR